MHLKPVEQRDFIGPFGKVTLHAAVYDHGDQPRVMYRVMCEGEKPYE